MDKANSRSIPGPPSPLPPWITIRTPPPSPPLPLSPSPRLSPSRVLSPGFSLPSRGGDSPADPLSLQKKQLMSPVQATLRRQDITSRGERSPFTSLVRESTPGESLAQYELNISEILFQSTPIYAVVQKLRGTLSVSHVTWSAPPRMRKLQRRAHFPLSSSNTRRHVLKFRSLETSRPTEPPINDLRGGVTSALPSQYVLVNECCGGQSTAFNFTYLGQLLPTTLERSWAVGRTTPTGYHSALFTLSVVIYLFSNNLASENYSTRSTYEVQNAQNALFDSLDSILVAIPERQLQILLHSRLASIRGAWEGMLLEAGEHKQQRLFTTLVEFGLQNGWIAQAASNSGHVYLLYAASMNLLDLLQKLLDAGCRPHGSLHHIDRARANRILVEGDYVRSAVTEA